jgi:hypothetical protein
MEFIFLFLMLALSFIFSLPKVKGYLGERSVKLFLRRLDKEKYFIAHDVMVKRDDGKTSQIDHVIVSQTGIFVIETKNYRGWIYGSEKSKNWTQVIYKRKEQFLNPVLQNKGHIQALKEQLGEEMPYYSIISFSTRADLKKIEIQSPDTKVIYTPNIAKAITAYKQNFLSKERTQQIYQKLITLNISDKTMRKEHVNTIQHKKKVEKESVSLNNCPKCGNKLVERKGKYGSFKGCSSYPKCRYTA